MSVGLGCESSSSRHRPGQVLADLAPRAKVVLTVVCSTFTRGAKPATRKVADGERMNPQGKGWRARANKPGDVEHQGDVHQRAVQAGALPPCPRAYGLVGPAVSPPYVLRGRGRIFPAPAREIPHPEFGASETCPFVPDRTVNDENSRSLAKAPSRC